jgi:hypothetical protein
MTEIIDRIVYDIEDVEEAVNLVKTISSAHELYALLDHYNWDVMRFLLQLRIIHYAS